MNVQANHYQGYLPKHYLSNKGQAKIRSYVNDYLKEEIAEEGLLKTMKILKNAL